MEWKYGKANMKRGPKLAKFEIIDIKIFVEITNICKEINTYLMELYTN